MSSEHAISLYLQLSNDIHACWGAFGALTVLMLGWLLSRKATLRLGQRVALTANSKQFYTSTHMLWVGGTMSTLSRRSLVLLVLGAVVLAVVAFALIKRDAIGDLLLKGGGTSLTGQSAQSSPQARLALDFLSALRAFDVNAMTQLTTGEQTARIQREVTNPTPDFQSMKTMMLSDLPADSTELRSKIKNVQIHKNRGVVTFETKANSWFVMLEEANGKWKVAGF